MGYKRRIKSPSETAEDYKRFRNSLSINFKDIDIDSKEYLKKLLRVGGYRHMKDRTTKEWYNAHPTQKQLDFAWKHLKTLGIVKVEERFIRKLPPKKKVAKKKPKKKIRVSIKKVGDFNVIFKDEKQYKKIKENVVIITPKTFKKKQIRSKKTGRIIGWI